MVRIGLAFLMCAVLGITGCTQSSSTTKPAGDDKKANPLHGTWEGAVPELKGITLVFTFAADGKFTVETVIEDAPKAPNVKVDNGKQEGTYKQADKTITATIEGKEKVMTVKELTDAKMVLTNDKGQDMTFTKKK